MKFLFCTDSSLERVNAGDSIYSNQIYSSLKRNDSNIVTRLDFDGGEERYLLKALVLFVLLLPVMWRKGLKVANMSRFLNAIETEKPDVIVVDHFRLVWLIWLFRFSNSEAKLWHISHNVESKVQASIAEMSNFKTKLAKLFESKKIAFFERVLLKRVDFLSCITGEDLTELECLGVIGSKTAVGVVKPHRPKSNHDKASAELGRVCYDALIIGSFYWQAKQINLLEFLKEKPCDFNNVKVAVAGGMPEGFSLTLNEYDFVTNLGSFGSLSDLEGVAHCAVSPDRCGGGFKLKLLDYLSLGYHIIGFADQMNGIDSEKASCARVETYRGLWEELARSKVLDSAQVSKINREYVESDHSHESMDACLMSLFS